MRLPDWQTRLRVFVRSVAALPYQPGVNDCATFTMGAVEAMTGADHLTPFLGYRSIEEGIAKVQAAGFADHVAYVAEKFEECAPAFAQVGDIAVVEARTLGIVQGANIYVISDHGFGVVPITSAVRAFRV